MKEIEIVDAHGEIVGSSTLKEAHSKGLLHRVAFVMLFDVDGRLFVQKRSPKSDLFPGMHEGSLTGHVEKGETIHYAASRELLEELGVVAKGLKEVCSFGLHNKVERVLVSVFVMKDYKGKITLNKEEVYSGDFWPIEYLKSELKNNPSAFHPFFVRAWKEFCKFEDTTKEFV